MIEEWRPVPGWPYEVSTFGRVRRGGNVLRDWACRGYRQVNLYREGKRTRRYVHTLVLTAFVGPRPAGMEACHANADRADNRIANLRWDTSAANSRDTLAHGSHANTAKTTCPRGHLLIEPNLVAGHFAHGHRTCLACNRANSHASKRREPIDAAEAQRKYDQIMNGEAHGCEISRARTV